MKIAPNDGSVERVGNVTIRSFLVESKIAIKQGGLGKTESVK